ncbi:SAM-dependent methyltransferase [Thermaurantimonas aggregans]|uniref:SAM-dependent methyltransferase n=1 Tax=Thermaurantimonas aggregans TaxID=2173829 RepID=A0A401XKE4_9FLAO|nr:class I SAM-dependent methyltransferase [Thermaurantimonas aggregans]MCX8149340.1 class I SAM-dependent methyltransferase [Thermaurantimonas aggregans]GCD77489.1 SAM-dependent methyltransferase [Thermaurantimonas aggregans]
MKKIFRLLLKYIPRTWLIRGSYLAKDVLALFMYGSRYEDPIDGRTYRSLLPYGYGNRQRPNVLAPASLSLERHRLMWIYLKKQTDFFTARLKVLHIAPEQCFYGRFKKMKNLDYTTADLESPLADLHFDLHDIPLPDNTYDVVFCNHVLEHVNDDIRCMQEIRRIMKPGGWAIMQVPLDINRSETFSDPTITDRAERERIFGQYDHVRVYGTDYPRRLEQAGFKVEVFDVKKLLTPEQIDRFRVQPDELLYIARKI